MILYHFFACCHAYYFGDAEIILDNDTDVRSDDEDDEFFLKLKDLTCVMN